MAGTFKVYANKGYDSGTQAIIASNSLVAEVGDLITAENGLAVLSEAGDTIFGVSHSNRTYGATNATTTKDTVLYAPVSEEETYLVPAVGTLTDVMVGQFFDIDDNQNIDVSTASATTGQLQLVEFVDDSNGIVKIVNA